MIHSIIRSWNIVNKRILLRADLNVLLENGNIVNDFRLESILPTLNYLIEHNGNVVLATHIGRPIAQEKELSTHLLVDWFTQRGYNIVFEPNLTAISHYPITPRQIILMENLRFFTGEKTGDPFFAKQLANTAQFYVNDAFGAIHRNDTSISLVPYEFSENRRSIGFLVEKELRILTKLRDNPSHPFVAIMGGAKIEEKVPLIHGLLKDIDTLLICPAICFSFLKALGKPVGKSLVNDSIQKTCKAVINEAQAHGIHVLFPIDYQIADNTIDGNLSVVTAEDFPRDAVGISIGPKTVELFSKEIYHAQTIFLNCAMGFADRPNTRQSTYNLIKAMAQTEATTVIAGGDSIDAAYKSGASKSIDHLSIGGGAALAYLSGNTLPGLTAFAEE